MAKGDRVRKRCSTCGKSASYRVRDRVCKFGERNAQGYKTGWRCPGKLERVVKTSKGKARPSGYDVAKGKHATARKMVEAYSTQLRRTATLLHKWIRKERYYTDRMAEAAAAATVGMDAGVVRTITLAE